MPEVRSCQVSYRDREGVRHSVDVTAGSLFEAAILGMTALKAPRWQDDPNLKIEVVVKQPEIRHEIWNSVLSAWLSRNGKSPKEQALKARLKELMRS